MKPISDSNDFHSACGDAIPLNAYRALLDRYEQAIQTLLALLMQGKSQLEACSSHTLIRSLSSRIKSLSSIESKLERMHLDVNIQSMETGLYDVAGVRVICSYLDDIYSLAQWICCRKDVQIVEIKDYIASPKPSGYRSFHILLQVPVSLPDYCGPVKCELQLRTTAMDSWAALEHQLRYKKGHVLQESLQKELYQTALTLYETDLKMQSIYHALEGELSQEDLMRLPEELFSIRPAPVDSFLSPSVKNAR